ncbi:MAG: dihydroorotase [Acidimicrobiia bacterium]
MNETLFTNARLVTADGVVEKDILVKDAVIAEIGTGLHTSGETIDCAGSLVGPGLVDIHVHFREPGQEWKEDIGSGSAAAAAGGFTAVVTMANTDPAIDAGHLARFVIDRGRQEGLVEVVPAGAITMAREGKKLAHLDDLWAAGVRIFSDDGDSVEDAGLLRRAMEYLAELGGVVAQHPEDRGLTANGHMHEGSVSSRLGMAGLPALGEETVVARDLALVRLTGVRYHVQHVSTAGTVELVRSAKAEGLPVTAEATPHHLMLDHGEVVRMNPDVKMYPPLRRPADVEAVRAGLKDGTLDVVATDHAPHAAHEKDVPFEEAPRGIIGLETAAAVVNTAVGLDPVTFFQRMSVSPAHLAGLSEQGRWAEPGGKANLVVFDPSASWTPDVYASRAENSPFTGRQLQGRVVATMYGGRLTFRDGKVQG